MIPEEATPTIAQGPIIWDSTVLTLCFVIDREKERYNSFLEFKDIYPPCLHFHSHFRSLDFPQLDPG